MAVLALACAPSIALAGASGLRELPTDGRVPAPDARHPPSVYEAGHRAVAEALGLVATRCWVGDAWDTQDLVGKYHQKISNGWYTNVESDLAGQRGVEIRQPDPAAREKVDFETLFVVSWRAERPGEMVPCTVHRLERGDMRVRVLDAAGAPAVGAQVYGCGGAGTSDDEGIATLEGAHAGFDCALHAYSTGFCEADLDVPALLGDEIRSATMRLECVDPADPDADAGEAFVARIPGLAEPSDEDELAHFRELRTRSLGPGADALLDELIAHRQRMIASRKQRAEQDVLRERQLEQIATLLEQIEATSDPAAKERIQWELDAQLDALRANVPTP